jgi:glycosyltransferase involved in cell wall biosynthesis
MKIFFRISKLGFGGAEQVFLSVARALKIKSNIEIVFVVDNMVGKNVTVAQEAGFTVVSLNATRTLTSILPLARLINSEQPDIILSAYTDTNAACLLSGAISMSKTSIIVSEHASLKEHWQSQSSLKKRILKFYVGTVYKLAKKVICVSKGLESQVNTLLLQPEKTTTIYNPVRFDGKLVRHGNNSNTLNLVAVGRIVPQKDYSTLIKAIAIIKKSTDVRLLIVGGVTNEPEVQKVKQLIMDNDLVENIELVGYSNSVSTYYQSANIFVLSSAWEGFGNVIIEAMAFGLPIVSTNCNYGPAEILENGKYGRLVDVRDSGALANSIMQEATNPLVASEVLIERSKEFSENIIAEEYNNVFMEVMQHEA